MLRLRHDCDHHLAAALLGRGEGGHPRHLRELWHLELGHLELGHLEPVAQGRYAHQILGGFESVVVEKKRGGAGARRVGPHMPHRQLEQVERERRAIRKAEGAFCHLAGGEMCSPGVHRRSTGAGGLLHFRRNGLGADMGAGKPGRGRECSRIRDGTCHEE